MSPLSSASVVDVVTLGFFGSASRGSTQELASVKSALSPCDFSTRSKMAFTWRCAVTCGRGEQQGHISIQFAAPRPSVPRLAGDRLRPHNMSHGRTCLLHRIPHSRQLMDLGGSIQKISMRTESDRV